jgi:hypothetical protein
MRIYALFCALVVLGFAWLEWRGIDPFPESKHVVVPSSVRGAPGAYRSFHYYGGGGFRGGK